jgi:hypothetical protein
MPVILGADSISIDGKVIETCKSVGTYPDPLGTGEPVVTAGGSVTPVIIDADYKYLALTYELYPILSTDVTNLKAWYKFDGNGNDSSGNNKNLTAFSPIYNSNDKIINQSSQYNNEGYFEIANDGYFSPSTFSLSLWFKQTIANTIIFQSIATCRDIAPTRGWILYITPQNALQLWFGKGESNTTWDTITVLSSMPVNVWTNIIITVERTIGSLMNFKSYINGVEINNLTDRTYVINDNNLLRIGAGTTEAIPNFFVRNNNLIDDFRIYDRVLTTNEISELYNLTPPNQTSYTINFPEDTECDILMVAGGGGGGTVYSTSAVAGAGGGAGGLIFLQNQTIPADNYTIKVGKGGDGDTFADTTEPKRGKNGYNSSFSYLQTEAIGGGGGGSRNGTFTPSGGGSGGGGGYHIDNTTTVNGGAATITDLIKYDGSVIISNYRQGFKGGDTQATTGVNTLYSPFSSGGGGAGEEGYGNIHTPNELLDGNGGNGLASQNDTDFKTHFNITDTNIGEHDNGLVYFAGGGSGGFATNNNSVGGLGGGADSFNGAGLNGQPNTGGGGSGSRAGSLGQAKGGNGGSGIVIIRYPRTKIPFDAQWTYNTSNANVYHMGNVGIGITNPTNALHVIGNTFSTTYSASSKTFKIEHPLKLNKWLYHGCIEGPRFDNIYRGKKLITNGKADVDIDTECNTTGGMTPGTFPALNTNPQLFLRNNQTYDRVKGKINGSTINIECENTSGQIEIDWMVVGERHDEHVINTPLTDSDGNLICEHNMA